MAPAASVSTSSHSHHHQMDKLPSPNDLDLSQSSLRHTFTHLTYSRHHLIDTAMETIKIAENGEYTNSRGQVVRVKDDVDRAVENCVHYEHEFDFHAALKEYDDEECGLDGSMPSFEGLSSLHSATALKLSFNSSASSRALGCLPPRRFPRTSFLVVSANWLECASELLGSTPGNISVGVLNSASGTTPGGRFLKGTVSQEDCLCRASLLYSCISQPKFQTECRFYGKNRSFRYGSSNCVIFSPDVPVIRQDNVEGRLLDTPEKVSFVTLPAPNAFTTSSRSGKEYNDVESEDRQKGLHRHESGRKGSIMDLAGPESNIDFDEKFEQKRQALLSSLSDRIHRALSAFVLGGCTDLVLPAFGCGIHGNDPSMVASVFREMLTDKDQFGGRFRTVVFSIPPSRKQNYQAFAAYFHK